jgi:hypothetical protein
MMVIVTQHQEAFAQTALTQQIAQWTQFWWQNLSQLVSLG